MNDTKDGKQVVGFHNQRTSEVEPEEERNGEALGMKGVWMETLFVLVLGNNIFDILEWIVLFTEDFQIIYGVFPLETDILAHSFPLPIWLGFIFNPLAPRTYETYAVYIQSFSIALFAILFWSANGAYVAYTVYRGTYVVLPLHTFRLLSAFFPTVLFIPMVEMMLSAVLECAYKTDAHLHLVSKEIIPCLSGFHVVTYVLAIAALLFFIPASVFLANNFVSTDPTYKRPSYRVHGRCDAMFAILKVFLLVLTRVFSESFLAAPLLVMLVAIVMCYMINQYRPHYNNLVNNCRFASFASIFAFALMVLILRASHFIDRNGALAIVFPVSLATWVISFALSEKLNRRRCARVQQRLKEVETLTGFVQKRYFVFDDWPSVEIACRFITHGMDDRQRVFDDSKAPLVHAIFQRGVKEFPNVPFVHLSYHLYSNFMRTSSANYLYPLSATKGLAPAFDVAFFVYMTEGLESRQQQMALLGSHVDFKITEFAEYKKLEKAARFNHEKARQVMRLFWHLLSKDNSQPDTMSSIVSDVRLAVDEADKSYRRLLHMYPASILINRSYGAFLLEVKQEPETAESYIQRAEELEAKALAKKRGEESFGESTAEGSSSNYDIAEADLEPSPKEISESADRSMARRNSRASESSSRQSSASTTAARRITVKQNMSMAAGHRIKRFNIGSSIVILAGIGLIIGANVVVEEILIAEESRQTYGRFIRRRLYLLDEMFLFLRRMSMAAIASDEQEFHFQRDRLVVANHEYRHLALLSYSNLPTGMKALQKQYETPMFENLRMINPANITVVEKTTLFHFSEQYGDKVSFLLDRDFTFFAQANITFNDDFRYAFDNFYGLQTAFKDNMAEFRSAHANGHSGTSIEMWCFSAAICVTFISGAGYIIERWFRDMREHHLERLDLFKKIPKNIRTAIRDNLDSAAEDSVEPSQMPHLSTRIQPLNSLRQFRKRALVFVVCTCAMACAFAANGSNALNDMFVLAAVVTPLGELRSSAVTVDLYVTELIVQDVPTTWPNSSVIYEHFEDSFDYFSFNIDDIIYPSNISVALIDIPALFAFWFQPTCLSYNATICANPNYNYDIGFTPATIETGLGTLLGEYRNAAAAVAITAKGGILDANDPNALFISTANRFHMNDGIDHLVQLGVNTLNHTIHDNMMITGLIFALQLFVAILGYIFVFRAMSNWYRGRDDATNLLFMILPPLAVKSDPQIENFLKTGIITDVTEALEAPVANPREQRPSIFKNGSVLGSHLSLMVDKIRRKGSTVAFTGDEESGQKDDEEIQPFEAKLKKLQFEEETQSEAEKQNTPVALATRRMSDSQMDPPVRSDPIISM